MLPNLSEGNVLPSKSTTATNEPTLPCRLYSRLCLEVKYELNCLFPKRAGKLHLSSKDIKLLGCDYGCHILAKGMIPMKAFCTIIIESKWDRILIIIKNFSWATSAIRNAYPGKGKDLGQGISPGEI